MTIWDALAERLGRQPTHKEASDEVRRILREAREDGDTNRPLAGDHRVGSTID